MIAMWAPSLLFLLLISGFIVGFIILMIKLIKGNPKTALILLIVPIVLIAGFVLLKFFSYAPHRVYEAPPQNQYPMPILDLSLDTSSVVSSSPIWSEGIENEFEADIYPSKIAAIRSIALKIEKEFRHIGITDAKEMPESIVIVMNTPWLDLAEELRDAIINRFPEIQCRIVTSISTRNVNEATLTFTSIKTNQNVESDGFRITVPNGSFRATFSNQSKSTIISVDYVDRPWVEDFASFANSQRRFHYLVAKSNETCLTHGEANNQAIQDAIFQIRPMIAPGYSGNLNYDYLQQSGMVIDNFVQSFKGSSGDIWRQAILLDVSPEKLRLLSQMISGVNRRRSMTWARTIFSVLGLFVLIVIAYAFLNFATKGYYSITLKVVLVILGAIFLFTLLLIS